MAFVVRRVRLGRMAAATVVAVVVLGAVAACSMPLTLPPVTSIAPPSHATVINGTETTGPTSDAPTVAPEVSMAFPPDATALPSGPQTAVRQDNPATLSDWNDIVDDADIQAILDAYQKPWVRLQDGALCQASVTEVMWFKQDGHLMSSTSRIDPPYTVVDYGPITPELVQQQIAAVAAVTCRWY